MRCAPLRRMRPKAEYKVKKGPGESTFRDGMKVAHSNPAADKTNPFNFTVYGRSEKNKAASKKNNTRAEYEASKVEKAEPTMAKPVTKSPSSGPAGKVSAPKPSVNLAHQAPKL